MSISPTPSGRKSKMAFDFVAPHSLEECMYRLGLVQEQRDIDFAPRIAIKQHRLDADTCAFSVWERRPASITLTGYMNRLADDATYVHGSAVIQRRTYLEAAPIVGGIIGMCVVVGWGIGAILLPPALLFMQKTWRGSEIEQERLLRLTRDTLLHQ